ncbi:tetratricopeptide repeat protein [Longimicrobium sp.]|uniref:tetratricopeptide repeat protein n=1 Tax=Longimicrobium sp. TaxID=2029185 RepID=UPI002E327AD1|nr:tetratricopeptide repeat protein [Longimicrobium sp.]HEX6037629.1 tetratricopeptide repeat protein [Longimicrobium sp.]
MSEDGEARGAAERAEVIEDAAARAQSLGEDERWDEAYELLAEALEEQGDDPLLLTWAGMAAQRLGEESQAYDHFRAALAMEPSDPFVLAAAGSGLSALDDPAAEAALRMAALTAPEFPFARAAYGAYLAREGLFGEAIAELEAARGLAPEDAGVHAELGMAYLLAKRTDEGLDALEEALSRTPADSWLRGLFGLALVDAGRGEEGAEQLHQAAGERDDDVEVQLLAALAMGAQGWDDPAWAALARAEVHADSSDRELITEVEDRLEAGPEAADEFLREDLGPTLLRERLLQRA